MLICISGTPGTGKTAVAKELGKMMKANIIFVNDLIKKGMIKYRWDSKRKTKIVDVKNAEAAVKKSLRPGVNIVDSHHSHLMKCDLCVILRTNPIILQKRLRKRKWPQKKINENLMAEMLDEISSEAKGKYIEIDTSNISPVSAAKKIKKALNTYPVQKNCIDWTKKYSNLIIKLGVQYGSGKT